MSLPFESYSKSFCGIALHSPRRGRTHTYTQEATPDSRRELSVQGSGLLTLIPLEDRPKKRPEKKVGGKSLIGPSLKELSTHQTRSTTRQAFERGINAQGSTGLDPAKTSRCPAGFPPSQERHDSAHGSGRASAHDAPSPVPKADEPRHTTRATLPSWK